MHGIDVWGLFAFFLQTVVISLSGVMAPGPITATTIGKGAATPHAGAFVALGHGLVELPLMGALFLGAGAVFSQPAVRIALALLGGAFLLFLSGSFIIDGLRMLFAWKLCANREGAKNAKSSPLLKHGIPARA